MIEFEIFFLGQKSILCNGQDVCSFFSCQRELLSKKQKQKPIVYYVRVYQTAQIAWFPNLSLKKNHSGLSDKPHLTMSIMWEMPLSLPLTLNLTWVGHLEKKLLFPQGRTATA